MALVLARELRGRDIPVNTIAPGPTATALFLDGRSDEQAACLPTAAGSTDRRSGRTATSPREEQPGPTRRTPR
ncbi:hypothetical protein HMPREF3159_11900 [Brachybacterium sp. HMSC06H03]|nr:hypothetical protein HMPREF3159_11900 [Brachybacterium sp. HMSC06H03]